MKEEVEDEQEEKEEVEGGGGASTRSRTSCGSFGRTKMRRPPWTRLDPRGSSKASISLGWSPPCP